MLQSDELLVPRKEQEEAGVPLMAFLKDILVSGWRGEWLVNFDATKASSRAAIEWFCESLIALINQSFGPLLQGMTSLSCVCACEENEENPYYKYCGKWCLANVTNPTE